MRIISGKYKGRVIKMPKGIRPTQDKVRKALFDILGDVEGLSFLELFAGSGAVGLEAASAGAKQVVFIEQGRECVKKIKENLLLLGFLSSRVLESDVIKAIEKFSRNGERFDIIFLDPPYYKDTPKKTLQILEAYDILAPCGYIIVQHFKKDNLPESAGDLILFKQYYYGDTVLSLYKRIV